MCSSIESEPAYSSSVDLSNHSQRHCRSAATRATTSTTEDTEAALDRIANNVVNDVFGDTSVEVSKSGLLRESTASCTSGWKGGMDLLSSCPSSDAWHFLRHARHQHCTPCTVHMKRSALQIRCEMEAQCSWNSATPPSGIMCTSVIRWSTVLA